MYARVCQLSAYAVTALYVIVAVIVPLTSSAVISVAQQQVPQPADLTCWTCPNKTDNEACNNWAPDVNCPSNHSVCQTVHLFDMELRQSVAVHKRCALQSQCTAAMVGCRETHLPGVLECLTCCTQSYCNEHVPTNHRAALALSVFSATSTAESSGILLACLAVLLRTL